MYIVCKIGLNILTRRRMFSCFLLLFFVAEILDSPRSSTAGAGSLERLGGAAEVLESGVPCFEAGFGFIGLRLAGSLTFSLFGLLPLYIIYIVYIYILLRFI